MTFLLLALFKMKSNNQSLLARAASRLGRIVRCFLNMKEKCTSIGQEMRKNMKWQLGLDIQNWCFRFLPIPTDIEILPVKELSLKDIDKFGTAPDDDDDDGEEGDPYLCGNCGLWMSGFCYRHPLLFVKENTPKERPYLHHATFPEFFYLNESTIPKAGQGVFTTMALPMGVAFGPYSGFVSSSKKAETSGYSWQLHNSKGKDYWVDAKNPFYSNWMRYVNCARYEQEQNIVALLYNQNIYYYTYKPVAPYEELLVWYGREYGDYLNIKNALQESGPLAPVREEESIAIESPQVSDLLEMENVVESCTPSIEQVTSQSEATSSQC